MIDWSNLNTTEDDCLLIGRIATRARDRGVIRDRMDLVIDLEAAHHVCPLNLPGLHDATAADLVHDVVGIIQHLDRDTGELTDGFLPRYAV